MFRNLRLYRLDSAWPDSEAALSEKLASAGFEPCGPLTEKSSGFVEVYPDAGEALARRLGGADLMKLRIQSRVLPAAAVAEELEVRLEEYRNRMGEEPNGREKRRIKAETRDELLTKAMLKSERIWGYMDLREKVLAIESAGEPNAERFLRRLKVAFGDLAIRPLGFQEPVEGLMRKIFLGGAPGQFALGRECRMQDATEPKSKVRWTDFDLDDRSIRDHVAHGMLLTHVAVVYDNLMSFVIDEEAVLTKVKFLGVDDAADEESDPLTRFDAEFALASGTIRNLLGDLKALLGGYA
jgi:recombination associated protein RdgC